MSGRGLCVWLINRPEKPCRMQCDSLDDEIKKIQENPSVGSKLFQADRETDRQKEKQALTKLVVAFRNFAKAPKTTKVVYNSVSQRL